MAFLSIKSTCFLLIITLAFSSSLGGVEAFLQGIFKTATQAAKTGASAMDNIGNGVGKGLQYLREPALKKMGEELAGKVFGAAGKNGFHWGWNGSKYYFKVANKCESYYDQLRLCTPQSSDPLPSLSAGCVAQCVIEFASRSNIINETPGACTSHNVISCPYDAAEAKCKSRALTQTSCTLINV